MNKGLKIFLISLLIILIVAIITITTLKLLQHNNQPEETSPYSETAINVMKELNLYEEINKREYSQTIEVLLETNNLKEQYLENYYQIEYTNMTNFGNIINKLLDKNYNSEEINYITKNMKNDINILLNMDYIDILAFKDITNFDIENLERYLNYQKDNKEYDLATVVTYVNIGLDKEGYSEYTEYTEEEAQNDLTILVNKYHKLPDDYEPNDLVALSYNNGYTYYLRSEAAEAYEQLSSAALLDNVIVYPFSAYRSYDTQNTLYNRYVARDGREAADTYSARPGFSEHQLGLAIDIRSNTLNDNLTDKDYEWMLDNSYKYGFIVRYPKGKQHITQFMEEPWHLRYLGVELATKVHDSGLTYDEYYDLYEINSRHKS